MKLRPSTAHDVPVQKVSVFEIELAHAKLSASGAHRWLNCTASPWMESHFANVDTAYSEEGTRAHSVGSDCLLAGIGVTEWVKRKHQEILDTCWDREKEAITIIVAAGDLTDVDSMTLFAHAQERHDQADSIGFDDAIEEFELLYPQDMLDSVAEYLEYVEARTTEARERNDKPVILIERRVDFSRWVPEGFGHLDFGAVADYVCDVVDYKHGKGVRVEVTDNEQIMLYALGMYSMYRHLYRFREFNLTIFQPRIGNVQTWSITLDQLLRWAERRVQPVAKIVWHSLEANDLSGVEFDPSDPEMCQFCRAKVHCRARADARLEMAKYEKDVALMSDAEVMAILPEAEHLAKWAGDLKSWAATEAAKGKVMKGYKLVAGRANRKYVSERRIATILRLEGFKPEQFYKPAKLLGLTDMTALVKGKKKLDTLLGSLIMKPMGRPVLVPESDPRPVYKPAQDAAGQGFDADE